MGRALSKMAIKAAKTFDIEGNLAKSYKLTYPNASREELYYVSDFQTFADISEMPERAKEWLLTNFRDRFGDKQ
jgi:hypothetical protein